MISKKHFRLKKNGEPYGDCFCRTPWLIENYSKAIADSHEVWDCHHRRETHYKKDGVWVERGVFVSGEELDAQGMYYDVPPEELIFLSHGEHTAIHHIGKESCHKGKTLSDEAKAKLSAAKKGRHWYNNGIVSVWEYECPKGFVKGRLRSQVHI